MITAIIIGIIGSALGFIAFAMGFVIGLALGVSAGSIIDAVNRKKGAQNEQEKYGQFI